MQNYWEERYKAGDTPWTLNVPSPPIIAYIDQLKDKSAKILIPGAGIGYEAQYLLECGFTNITIIDISDTAIKTIRDALGQHTQITYVCADFFEFQGQFDIIIEQTFFCAIDRIERQNYVKKMASLIGDGGKLVGVLFASEFERTGPPHGGSYEEYLALFASHFDINTLELCYNSIAPRLGNELFFILKKRTNT